MKIMIDNLNYDTEVQLDNTRTTQQQQLPSSLSSPSSSQVQQCNDTTPRMGTIRSATLNIWCTMVGGGSLSLPLAFSKTGNLFMGPIVLIGTAIVTQFCFGIILDAIYYMNQNNNMHNDNNNNNTNDHQGSQLQQQHTNLPALSSVSTTTITTVTRETTTKNPSLNEVDGNDVEEAEEEIITERHHQQPVRQEVVDIPPLEEGAVVDQDTKSNYTLEGMTAAAAAAAAVAMVSDHMHGATTPTTTSTNIAYSISALLVLFMCFFGIIGYCVLLRDMLLPITQSIVKMMMLTTTSFQQEQQPDASNRMINQYHDSFFDFISSSFIIPPASTTTTMTETSLSSTATVSTTIVSAFVNNMLMIFVVLLVTPLCTLPTLTSLQKFSTLSMCSIVILGSCIVYRSVQCQLGYYHHNHHYDDHNTSMITTSFANQVFSYDDLTDNQGSNSQRDETNGSKSGFSYLPHNIKDVLDVLPLYISCYVCHYNIPVVYNDLIHPTSDRVRTWLHCTVWGATIFYCIIGIAGSSFALQCGSNDNNKHSTNNTVQGNVLLNFDPDDPLLLVGRLCLAITIALAFPVLTIPARDIILRYIILSSSSFPNTTRVSESHSTTNTIVFERNNTNNDLTEPLLSSSFENGGEVGTADDEDETTVHTSNVVVVPPNDETSNDASSSSPSWMQRLLVSICVLWTGTGIACCVSSIDIVWDFLGSSLSIILSYLVPCGCYIILHRRHYDNTMNRIINNTMNNNNDDATVVREFKYKWLPSIPTLCWIILSFFTPLMFISTGNAIYNLLSSQ